MIIKFLLLVFSILSLYFLGNFSVQLFKNKLKFSNKFLSASESIIIGLYLWGSFVFIFNFFFKINSNEFYISATLFFFIILLPFHKFEINKKHLKYLAIFTLLSFPLVLSMDSGYDAGLYHLSHQKIIREEKIIFGLSSFHNVYGLASFYEYLVAPLWIGNTFDNLANIQVIFYITLFLFLYEISRSDKLVSVYVLIFLLSVPFWLRYAPIKWGLVDFPFGVLFFLSVVTSTILFKSRDNIRSKHLFSFLIISTSMVFFLKPGGFIIGIITISSIYYLIKKNLFTPLQIIKLLTIPTFIVILWMVRGFINTSCLLYPFAFSCIDTKWGSAAQAEFHWSITKDWGQIIIDTIVLNLNITTTNLYIIFIAIIILFILTHNLIVKKNFKIKIKYFYISIIIIFLIQLLISNKNIDFARDQLTFNKIIIESIYLIGTFITFYILQIYCFGLKKINSELLKFKFIPLFFSILVVLIWISTAPIPRLGYSFIGSFFLTFLLMLNEKNTDKTSLKLNINLLLILIFLYNFTHTFFSDLKIKRFNFDPLIIPQIITENRKGFGVKPKIGDQCWDTIWCSPIEPYILKIVEINSYKFLIKKK